MGAITLASLADIQEAANGLRHTPTGQRIPNNARPVTQFGFIEAPDYGVDNEVELLEYTVPTNWLAEFYGVVFGFIGGAPVPLPGDLSFSVDIDRPVGSQLGYTEKDYGNIMLPLGALQNGPYWPIRWPHVSDETIRIKGFTVQNVPTGAGNFLVAALLGYEWPNQTKKAVDE